MIIPGVRKAHWGAKPSRKACWSGERPSGGVVPSSVLTVEPLIVSTGIRQLMTGSPSTWQVHVPHVPWPQPRLAAVRPSVSRRALSSVVPGWARNSTGSPLSCSSMTLDGMAEGPADVDGQDATAVPRAGVGVVEGVGGVERGLRGRVDVALRERLFGAGRADGLARDAAEGDPGAVAGDGDDRGAVLLAAHRLGVEPALGDLEADARDEALGLVDLRVEREQADREVAVRLGHEEVAADRGEVADARRGDRLDGVFEERYAAADLGERGRRSDADRVAVLLDAAEAGVAQAHQRLGGLQARHHVRAAGDDRALAEQPDGLVDRGGEVDLHATSTTGLESTPRPSISHSTTSPSWSERLGSMTSPQPHGVPVRITSPASRVKLWLQKLISSATPKIISLVLESCMTSPFTRVISLRFCGSSSWTSSGQSGQNVSRLFARTHWPSANCRSRADTSLPIV